MEMLGAQEGWGVRPGVRLAPDSSGPLPGLCPDWEKWDPNKPVQNAREAMQQADDWLGVPQVWALRGALWVPQVWAWGRH